MELESINPATGVIARTFPALCFEEIGSRIDRAHAAFRHWRRLDFAQRGNFFTRLADLLRERAGALATLITGEMGKRLSEALYEIEDCARLCEYYRDRAEELLKEESLHSALGPATVVPAPLGVILAIMPYNYPFWQPFRAAVAALMAGNAVLLKHAGSLPGCALRIEALFTEADFPEGLFSTLLVPSGQVPYILSHEQVRGVAFTGSTANGTRVAVQAAAQIKKALLELGGSDAYLVLEDADLDRAVEATVTSKMINAGQSCCAAKRVICVQPVRQEFEERLIEAMRGYVMGDPVDPATRLGPLGQRNARDQLHAQVQAARQAGASVKLGGDVPEQPGFWYPPTILTGVTPVTPAVQEELFGPVLALLEAPDEATAIAWANDSRYGLGTVVFTGDLERGEALLRHALDSGMGFVNEFVRNTPELPFGGSKASGLGRELGSAGIREFTQLRTLLIREV